MNPIILNAPEGQRGTHKWDGLLPTRYRFIVSQFAAHATRDKTIFMNDVASVGRAWRAWASRSAALSQADYEVTTFVLLLVPVESEFY